MADNYLEEYNAREGTSQRARLDKNLLPVSFQIDGRNTADLVRFAVKFSESLIYYDYDRSIKQNWKNFFLKERYVFIYIIASTNIYHFQKAFYGAFEDITLLTDIADIQVHLPELIEPTHQILNLLASWDSTLGFTDLTENTSINISELVNDQSIVTGIGRIYNLSFLNKKSDFIKSEWEEIDKAFSLNLISGSKKPNIDFKTEDLYLIRKTFERIYNLAEGIIKKANEITAIETEEHQGVRPHVALFFAFLKVYSILQKRINTITGKHLDYYFEEVLKIERRGKIPDDTFVHFELNPEIESHFLKKGTGVVAGKDASGTPLVYESVHNINLSKTKIKAIYTLFISQNELNYSGFENKKVITDIFYKKHNPADSGTWRVFGEDQFYNSVAERTMDNAKMGFIIASGLLELYEGERKISITISATNQSYKLFSEFIDEIGRNEDENDSDTFSQIFSTAFQMYITLDGTETLLDRYRIKNKLDSNGFSIEILLSSDDQKISILNDNAPANQPVLDSPYIKVMLRDESHIYAFPLIQILDIINIGIKTSVTGLKDFLLFNNFGQIDHSKPFQVFGAVPKVNSYFLIGSKEILGKPINKLDINLQWYQLPSDPDGWTGYFEDYNEIILNTDYRVEIEYLHSGVWEKVGPKSNHPLFEEEIANDVRLKKLSTKTNINDLVLPVDNSETKNSESFQPYTLQTRNGYIKLELVSPEFGFGFDAYHKNLYKSIKENAKINTDEELREPNPPLSPIVQNITLNYEASTEAFDDKGPNNTIKLYSLGPFGYKQRELVSQQKPNKILLDFKPEGHFMIGLDSYPKGGVINIFVRTQTATSESFIRDVPVPKWQYLKNNEWINIPANAIHFDGTKGFVQSGILNIHIPDSISNQNTLVSEQLYWLRAIVTENSKIAPGVEEIYTNVAQVRWNSKSDGSHLEKPLPIGSIEKLEFLDPKIIRVEQVLDSFKGKIEESKTDYYKRTSERLRHKKRAVNGWDYERLVLEKFPSIFKVKCFNALKYLENQSEVINFIEPGNILIVVTPDITNPHIKNKHRPKLGINMLIRIRDYLQKLSSPFVKIDVRNPYYERIRVICKVKFNADLNPGYYISKLNDDVVRFLTPWLYADDVDEQFGQSVYRSQIMSFVNKRNYVDFVTSFSVVKTNTEQEYFNLYDTARPDNNKEEIKPEFPWSILTSVRQHNITVIDDDKYRAPVPRGIDNMKLGVDFVITEKE